MNPAYLVGDPDGMRRLAAELRARASAIRAQADEAARGLSEMHFEAPVSGRLRHAIDESVARERSVAGEVEDMAQALMSGAQTVQATQEAARRAAAAAVKKAKEEAAKAAAAVKHR